MRKRDGPLGAIFETSWETLGASWKPLEGLLGASWSLLEPLRNLLEHLKSHPEASGSILAAFWLVLETSWELLGPS